MCVCLYSVFIFKRLSSSESITGINWSVAQSSFPLTVQLLNFDSYSYHTLLGLVISVGGLTESLVSLWL